MLVEINIRRFEQETDLDIMNSWLRRRNHPEMSPDDIPVHGFVASYHGNPGRPAAIAFLRACEGKVGIFDGLVSNPDVPSQIRHQALDEISSVVMQAAAALEMTKVIAWTLDTSTLNRSLRHGFKPTAHTFLVNNVTGENFDSH